MRFLETGIEGAWLVELEPIADERGYFARSFCARTFGERGLEAAVAQCSISHNRTRGTLRGMHYQAPPGRETKLVRCTRGRIFDVLLDLRPGSASVRTWVAFELAADAPRMLYIPPGVAHGFQTLEDHSEVFYQMSDAYRPDLARGVRWNDPSFDISWPLHPTVMSHQDRHYPDYEVRHEPTN